MIRLLKKLAALNCRLSIEVLPARRGPGQMVEVRFDERKKAARADHQHHGKVLLDLDGCNYLLDSERIENEILRELETLERHLELEHSPKEAGR